MESIITIKSFDRFVELQKLCPRTHWRINASHMPIDEMVPLLEQIEQYMNANNCCAPLFIDLQGTKMRLSKEQFEFEVSTGMTVKIFSESRYKSLDPSDRVDEVLLFTDDVYHLLTSRSIPADLKINLDDAKVVLGNFVVAEDINHIKATVLRANNNCHVIHKRKGINIQPHPIDATDLMPRDINIIKRTERFQFVSYCLSFINSFNELNALRMAIPNTKTIVAKLELPLPIEVIQKMVDEIANTNFWLCRGDLGSQLSPVGLMHYYSEFNEKIVKKNWKKARFVLAGEVMDHLLCANYPTRSEICHLADAMNIGYRGFVLSTETAIGPFYKECAEFLTKNMEDYYNAYLTL